MCTNYCNILVAFPEKYLFSRLSLVFHLVHKFLLMALVSSHIVNMPVFMFITLSIIIDMSWLEKCGCSPSSYLK